MERIPVLQTAAATRPVQPRGVQARAREMVVVAAEKRRLEVDSRTPAAAGKEGTAVGRVDERAGVRKRGEEGRATLRLCNLVAQRNAEGRLQAGDGEGANRAGSET
jgi:hypothetical protein